MQKLTIILVAFICLYSCKNEFELEDKLCDCYVEELSNENQNFHLLIDELESHFIESHLLKSGEGGAYLENCLLFSEDVNNLNVFYSSKIGSKIMSLFKGYSSKNCQFLIDDEGGKDFKYHKLRNKILLAIENQDYNFWKIYADIIGADGFEHDYYKGLFFIAIYGNSYNTNTIGRLFPIKEPIEVDETEPLTRNVLGISLNADDEIYVRNKLIEKDELYDLIYKFYSANSSGKNAYSEFPAYSLVDSSRCILETTKLSQSNSNLSVLDRWNSKLALCGYFPSNEFYEIDNKACIAFTNQGGTSYGLYMEVSNIIKQVVNDLKQEKCEELGWISYMKLFENESDNKEYFEFLRILVPEMVIESKISR